MKLNNDNYFSQEASMEYFGTSQIKAFDDCEARALAECKGEWKSPMTEALLKGSYIDAWFEGSLSQFAESHPEIFTQKGTLKAPYMHCNEIIERLQKDEYFMSFMAGKKQVIKTGEIDGYKFKIKIDSYHPNDKIVDLKIMRSLDRIMGKSFIEYWNYFLQGYIYQKVEGNNLPFFLAAGTSEQEPDLAVIKLEQADMNEAGEKMRKNLPRYAAIKRGEIEPERCEKCAYCKATKKLKSYISSDFVGFSPQEIKAMGGIYD